MLVIFNAFLHDYFHTPSAVPRYPSFASWVDSRPELRVYLESLAKAPEDALRLDLSLLSAAGDENAAVYAQRRGNVLLSTSILKCDYFQGCQNPKLPLRVEGAANCRCVFVLFADSRRDLLFNSRLYGERVCFLLCPQFPRTSPIDWWHCNAYWCRYRVCSRHAAND